MSYGHILLFFPILLIQKKMFSSGLLNMLKDPFFHFRAVQEVDKNNLTVHMEIQDLFSKCINFFSSFKASMEIIIIGN